MKRIPLEMDEALYERVKQTAGDVPVNRWIRRAIENELGRRSKPVPTQTEQFRRDIKHIAR